MAATMTEPIRFKNGRVPRAIPPCCMRHGEPIPMRVNGGAHLNAEGKYVQRFICPVEGCDHKEKRVVRK